MQITEQDIRRLAIGYLRLHYKYRPRKNWNGIQVVDREHEYEGITIDARLTYEESDDKIFVATVEASSLDKAREVFYRHHWFRLLFESLTLALIALAVVIGPLGNAWYGWLESGGVSSNLIAGFYLTIGLWTFFMLLLQISFVGRYRYIYAVEQFKLFHADDQWIAYDTALFEAHEDKRFMELERQCVRYGFGIMEVERDRDVRVLVAPKRGDYFENKRRRISPLTETLAKAPVVGAALSKRLGRPTEVDKTITFEDPFKDIEFGGQMPSPKPDEVESVKTSAAGGREKKFFDYQSSIAGFRTRYGQFLSSLMPGFMKDNPGFFNPPQGWRNWFLFALILNFGIIGWQITSREVNEAKVSELDGLKLEKLYRYRNPTDLEAEAELNDFSTESDEYLTTVPPSEEDQVLDEEILATLEPAASGTDVRYYRITATNDTLVRDICPRFGDPTTTRYALIFGRYNNLDTALDAAFELHRQGDLDVSVAAGDCLRETATPYLIMLGLPSANESEVNLRFRQMRQYGVEILGF
ncbi:hypothetical protein CEQ90_02330 [Lewinellaceae bacterium SD302]|nr:hypothetical protein CEQ90_02330 [Lewinellaceae bacterium SD302]